VVSSPHATGETGAMGREIEPRRGIGCFLKRILNNYVYYIRRLEAGQLYCCGSSVQLLSFRYLSEYA
jgi:hypothetical protein